MSPLAQQAWDTLAEAYPSWAEHFDVSDSGELEVFVPSPNERVGGLIVFTSGEDLWVRFSPPQMCYPLDNTEEMLGVVAALLADEALFVRTTSAGKWTGTTLIHPGDMPVLENGETAQVLSWSGRFDSNEEAGA